MIAWSHGLLAERGLASGLVVPASKLEAREARARVATRITALDRLLGGGWPRAALSELIGARSSGRTAVLLASLAAALSQGEAAVLIDVGGGLDVRMARRAGFELARLLWVRADLKQALAAAELVVAAGGFGLVAVDLADLRSRVPTAAWQRLRRAAERLGTAVLLAATNRVEGAQGACTVTLHSGQVRFSGSDAAAGYRLLTSVHTDAALARQRSFAGAMPTRTVPLRLERR